MVSASLEALLDRISADSDSEYSKGRRFESIMRRALERNPNYRQRFRTVRPYAEWARERGEVAQDSGIDLVAELRDSDRYAAIQCKFYRVGAALKLDQIDRFLAAAGREVFSEGYFIWTGGEATALAKNRLAETNLACQIINRAEIASWDLNWDEVYERPEGLRYGKPHQPQPHQEKAIAACLAGFAEHDRGQLILPCGTGKTAATLWLAERQVGLGGRVLYLVPSLALVAQAMREWAQHGQKRHRYLAVCSDVTVAREKEDDLDFALAELAIPPTTEAARIGAELRRETAAALTVVFSTYQSLERIAAAQDGGAPAFDLVICDEAHRTTGVEKGADEGRSPFTLVHDEARIRAQKRLYTTATPRLYNPASKSRAQRAQRELYSMDDESVYGKEFHRLNFGEAIDANLLADYHVSILCISREKMDRQLRALRESGTTLDILMGESGVEGTLDVDDVARIIGCWDALADPEGKLRTRGISGAIGENPCTTALAFANTIRNSKNFRAGWEAVIPEYAKLQRRQLGADESLLAAKVEHVDGTDSSVKRRERLRWLEEATGEHQYEGAALRAHILSNARCLTEGVDVPALDAILFIAPRRSTVDIVQAVGRVMRKARGKDRGYIILPVVVTEDQDPERALEDSAFQMVWDVLSALRSHDDRLDAEASLDLREKLKDRIKIWPVNGKDAAAEVEENDVLDEEMARQLSLQLADIEPGLIYAKIVERVGDREYLPKWSKRTAEIHEDLCARLRKTIIHTEAEATKRLAAEELERMQGLSSLTAEELERMQGLSSLTAEELERMQGLSSLTAEELERMRSLSSVTAEDLERVQNVPSSFQAAIDELHETIIRTEAEATKRLVAESLERVLSVPSPFQGVIDELHETIIRTEAEATKRLVAESIERLQSVPSPFRTLVEQLRDTINPTLGEDESVELLAQHLITRPVFVALSGPEAIRENHIARALDGCLAALSDSFQSPEELSSFYRRILYLAEATPKQKQEAQLRLYEGFFRAAIPKQAQRLGVFYTPAPVVDYLLRSADFALQEHFGVRLCDEGVDIIDPFAGTGTFLERLIANEELMPQGALPHKFHNELHANEILLLAYHMADFNITQAYRARGYEAVGFPGMVLFDTFYLHELHYRKKGQQPLPLGISAENAARAQRQNEMSFTVVFSNPPYRAGQKSGDDDNPNTVYHHLRQRIADTYAARSGAINVKTLYDSYKLAIRWGTDRLGERGALCFITSAGYIDGNADAGIRACFRDEFAAVHVFNLRGAVLKGKAEGGNIFDIRQPVALAVLIKDAEHEGPCQIHYYETDDFMTRGDKFDLLEELRHIGQTPYRPIVPNRHHQWLNQRDDAFDDFLPMGNPKTKAGKAENAIFRLYAPGIVTNRDPWMYDFSRANLARKTQAMVEYYEAQLEKFSWGEITYEEAIKPEPKRIKWTRGLRNDLRRKKMSPHSEEYIHVANHRPFTFQNFYYDTFYAEAPGRVLQMYPLPVALSPSSIVHRPSSIVARPSRNTQPRQPLNLVICVNSPGAAEPDCFITGIIADLHLIPAGTQCFSKYTYRPVPADELFGADR